jgi:hypothetical protein
MYRVRRQESVVKRVKSQETGDRRQMLERKSNEMEAGILTHETEGKSQEAGVIRQT